MKNIFKLSLLLLLTIPFAACSDNNEIQPGNIDDIIVEAPEETENKPNILLIIVDDMGLDACPNYPIGTAKPYMPTLQTFINNGITFNNVWSNPTCTPTRATILTGKYGFRTNVLKVDDVLSTSETSIQKYLDDNLNSTYNHAVIGKWHLAKTANHPTNMDVNYYAGSLGGGLKSYWNWNLTENSQTTNSTEYNTTKYTDLAIDWVEEQTKPWFLWLAYNAPHDPFHLPPTDLHTQGSLPTDQASIDANPLPYYLAMLEAMDTEIGRLLSSMPSEEKDNTVIIFVGDNGTPNQVVQEYNSRRAKGSIYQGGINVPLIISGKDVIRINETEDALINLTDLFVTIANIAGTTVSEINDSKSFKEFLSNSEGGKRNYIYSEAGESFTNSDIAIRNKTHKYMLFEDNSESFYNLSNDPLETINLLNPNRQPLSADDELIKNELISRLNEIRQ